MTKDRDEREEQPEVRWSKRPAAAAIVHWGLVAVPVFLSVGVALVFENVLPEPSATLGRIAWWLGVLGVSTAVLLLSERFARRLLPLATLLKMGMLFPGVAPKRLAIARRAAGTAELDGRMDDGRSQGLADQPEVAAENIVSLAASLSAHDRRTRGHTERVRALTDLVAGELGLKEGDRDRLRWSALLHDIGKLSVHPDVLNKEGSLSDEEWELIRRHPLEGARIAAPLSEWLGIWASTIAEHHERYDGSGYPFGLSGDSISLGGRIVAVTDAYDVMTSDRSYKSACTPEAARMELARCAGTQFDPAVVRAFLAVPVRRLRALLPLPWLGSIPYGDLGPGAAVAGRAAVALLAVGSIVGLTSAGPATSRPSAAAAAGPGGSSTGGAGGSSSGPTSGGNGSKHSGGSGPGGAGGGSATGGPGGSGSAGGSATTTENPRGSSGSAPGSPPTGGSGSPPGTGGSSPTTNPGSPPTTEPGPTSTTSPGSPPTTSPPSTTTTTTPPVGAATRLRASYDCRALGLADPEITLDWTDSTSRGVAGYDVFVSNDNGASYSQANQQQLSASTTSYTDTNQLMDGTYLLKILTLSTNGDVWSAVTSVKVSCFLNL
jgi:putative nucleotidyltransferase with HDIG domain